MWAGTLATQPSRTGGEAVEHLANTHRHQSKAPKKAHKGMAHKTHFHRIPDRPKTGPNQSEISCLKWPCGLAPPVKRRTLGSRQAFLPSGSLMCACAQVLPQTGGPGPIQTTPMTHISASRVHRQVCSESLKEYHGPVRSKLSHYTLFARPLYCTAWRQIFKRLLVVLAPERLTRTRML